VLHFLFDTLRANPKEPQAHRFAGGTLQGNGLRAQTGVALQNRICRNGNFVLFAFKAG